MRLHRIDENVSGEVAPLLAFLRDLQRRHRLAVIVVHHARKGAATMRAGQALRGSSEFHAWGDSNLYLRRDGETLSLTVEHRAAASMPRVNLELVGHHDALALQVLAPPTEVTQPAAQASIDERIVTALADTIQPVPFIELRRLCRVRNATLYQRLPALIADGRIIKSGNGYQRGNSTWRARF